MTQDIELIFSSRLQDLTAYRRSIFERFENPLLPHQPGQIARDSALAATAMADSRRAP